MLLIAAAALWAAVPGIDVRSIENHEHPRFARIAQNVVEDGEWVLLRYGQASYTNKPPLLVWQIAGLSLPFGHVNTWTARLPSALMALLGGLATYGVGRRLADRRVGLWAALILLSSWKWTWYAHSITTDMLLSGWIAVAMYCGVRAARRPRRQAAWWLAAGLAAGLACLTKGPIGVLVPVAVGGVAWGCLGKERPPLRLSAALLPVGAAAMFLPWVVLLAQRIGWAEVWAIVDREMLHRMTSTTGQAKPVWYYALKLPGDIVPWSLLWPGLLVGLRPRRMTPERRRTFWVALAWAVVPVVLFTLSRGKASRFILCAYPGWALLCALLVDAWLSSDAESAPWYRRAVVLPLMGAAGVLLIAPVGALLAALNLVPALAVEPRHVATLRVAGLGGLLAGLMAVYLFVVHRGAARARTVFGIVVVGMLGLHAVHLRLLGTNDDAFSPYKVAARELRWIVKDRPLVTYRFRDHRLLYYLDARVFMSADNVQQRFAAGTGTACLFTERTWAELEPQLAPWTEAVYDVQLVDVPLKVVLSRAAPAAIVPPVAAPGPRPAAAPPPS